MIVYQVVQEIFEAWTCGSAIEVRVGVRGKSEYGSH